jgi:Concanavalin A-like lectin/glucanases superfamily/IPT/TIG domain
MGRTVLALRVDDGGLFNASSSALKVTTAGRRITATDSGGLHLDKTSRVKVAPAAGLDAFTLSVEATADSLRSAQVLVDSEQPPIKLSLRRGGTVAAEVRTENGWEVLESSATVEAGTATPIRLVRAAGGRITLEVGGKVAAQLRGGATLTPAGSKGMTLGTDLSGEQGFVGRLDSVELLAGAVTTADLRKEAAFVKSTVAALADRYRAEIRLIPSGGTVDHRFDEIKAIMRGAGVTDLAELATLTIAQPTAIHPNQILTAPRRSIVGGITGSFAEVATEFLDAIATDAGSARRLLDRVVVNRSSKAAAVVTPPVVTPTPPPIVTPTRPPVVTPTRPPVVTPTRPPLTPGPFGPGAFNPALRPVSPSIDVSVTADANLILTGADHVDALATSLRPTLPVDEIVAKLRPVEPHLWPTFRPDIGVFHTAPRVTPVDSSVIIAGRLDLTNTILEIAPEVATLYIIAEEIQASTGAQIRWRRPDLSVPDHGPDPGKDGHGWGTSNVVLKPNSKHGQDGSDGRTGDDGIAGRNGSDAPNVEIWAKRFIGMPDIDVAGQTGGRGGKGQRGGHGGSGARGRSGEWYWFFGKHCWDDPGDGGDGGNGGRGGGGGRGGNGGNGAKITLAVLPDTLTQLVTTNAFTPQVQRGEGGDGGSGGDGGNGGPGGMRGYTEVCDGGRRGHDGAQAQPGPTGPDGSPGTNGHIQIMTVTEEAWNEQLTKPWLTHLTPTSAFPGTVVTIRGSRFADTDRVIIGTHTLTPTVRADEGLDVTLPTTIEGGEHTLFVRRHDGEESNRLKVGIRPHLDGAPTLVSPDTDIPLDGKAFVAGASVSLDGALYPANVTSRTKLTFRMPGISGPVTSERLYGLSVVNPDGRESNQLTATQPQILQNGFTLGVHDYQFDNFSDGVPSFDTFEETFGSVEVWHELLDPIFGHPVLTGAYYAFYHYFLLGEDNGGLATGFCTSLASTALDRFWQGHNDTFTAFTKADLHERLTAVHGRLLSRENLLTMHDQGRKGSANIETTFRVIESNFASGGTRETAPLLFFIPSGAAWDSGYFDKLADSHCVVPIRLLFPSGYDGTDIDGVDIQVWDNNAPADPDCRVEIRRNASGDLEFQFFSAGSLEFGTADGVTLGTQTVGQYLLSDVDLPFSGPFGLTSFIVDFILSPATLQVTDGSGRRTGHFGGQILAEIPDSHPAYLVPGMFLLPSATGMTRTITGTATGTYGYTSINPAGVSLNVRDVPTSAGTADIVAVNADGTRARFIPSQPKTVNASVAAEFNGQARGIEIEGFAASASAELDITATPDLSLVRIANRGSDVSLPVKLLGVTAATEAKVSRDLGTVNVPAEHDLVVAVTDWSTLSPGAITATSVDSG